MTILARLVCIASMFAPCTLARADSITIDFGRQTAESTYLLFGAASPNPRHTAAWEKLAPAGVTSLRFDACLGNGAEPRNITLDDYRANLGRKGSVADINSPHWNWSRIDGQPQLFRFVKVFHLLSKVLGLGERGGTIRVFDSRVSGLADEISPRTAGNLTPLSECQWTQDNINRNSPEKWLEYGRFLGRRWKDRANIVWQFDNDPINVNAQHAVV